MSQRTLADIRAQVASELAIRTISKSELVDATNIGVALTLSKDDDEAFLILVADALSHAIRTPHLFILATTPGRATAHDRKRTVYHAATPMRVATNALVICGHSPDIVHRASLLASAKFAGRIEHAHEEGHPPMWVAAVREVGAHPGDEAALWDVVKKAARAPMDPLLPPPGSRSAEEMYVEACARLARLTPEQAWEELHDPTYPMPVYLIDIRDHPTPASPLSSPCNSRHGDLGGTILGAFSLPRTALEDALDPRSPTRLAIADRYDTRIVLLSQDGRASARAAAALHDMGLLNATDVVGGYEAWVEVGLPGRVSPPSSRGGGSVALILFF